MSPRRVLALMPDLDEPAVARDLAALRRDGAMVATAAFRRGARARADLDLGRLPMGLGPARLAALARALPAWPRLAAMVRAADSVLARNLDMGLLALAAGAGGRRGPPLVYQCLDIHDLVTRPGLAGHAARRAERLLLARAARLVISAPAFLPRHFARYGDALPPVDLRENRLATTAPRPDPPPRSGPLRLGWVGTLRCPRSLDLLLAAARRLPRAELHFHGHLHAHALPGFAARIAAAPNVTWHGPYRYPDDLGRIYGRLDLVWAQDLWQGGGNSDWLLPNRLYEAGFHGCPVLAVNGTETAAWIRRHGTGWILPDASADTLTAFLQGLTRAALSARRRHVLALPANLFAAAPGDAQGLVAPPRTGDPAHAAATAA